MFGIRGHPLSFPSEATLVMSCDTAGTRAGRMSVRYLSDIFTEASSNSAGIIRWSRTRRRGRRVGGGTGGSEEASDRDQVLKLLGDGLGDNEVAKKVGTTPNHVWAIRVASGIRPVSERQLEIAKTIVARKRRQAAR
jgi:hypothetical protein